MRKKDRCALLLLLIIPFLLTSCSRGIGMSTVPSGNEETPTEGSKMSKNSLPTLKPSTTFTAITNVISFTPEPLVTLTQKILPSITLSPPQPTATYLPTLSDAEKDDYFREAMEGTENCRWPCFGNVTPGTTTWDDAIRTLSGFLKWESDGSSSYKNWSFKFKGTKDFYEGYLYHNDQNMLGGLRVSTDLKTNILKVSTVLKMYGTPSEIFVHPNAIGPGDIGVLQLVLVYRNQNAILYYEWDEKQVGNNIIGYDASRLYNSLMTLTIIDGKNFSWTPEAIAIAAIPYKSKPTLIPLHEISQMTIEQFYKAFIDPNTTQTIPIPINAIQ